MKIVVATRCLNEEKNIERFVRGYDFADEIIVSDGGSTDSSLEILARYPKVNVVHYGVTETVEGETWNPDCPHANFVINAAKGLNPDWLILDDMDCVPNKLLRVGARYFLENCKSVQVNAFRLYLWGDDQYFPKMNNYFTDDYKSLWAWKPREIYIHADESQRHGTYLGLSKEFCGIDIPMCLLHRSWHPDTIDARIARYNKLGIGMGHPLDFASPVQKLPEWAREE